MNIHIHPQRSGLMNIHIHPQRMCATMYLSSPKNNWADIFRIFEAEVNHILLITIADNVAIVTVQPVQLVTKNLIPLSFSLQ